MLKKELLTAVSMLAVVFTMAACQNTPPTNKKSDPITSNPLNYPIPLSPSTPFDVDVAVKKYFDQQQKFVEVQRLFEVLSWQNFVALNWPQTSQGKPQKSIADHGQFPWQQWKESFEVFKQDGSQPAPWGEHYLPNNFTIKDSENIPIMFRTNRMTLRSGANIEDEFDQAFTAPIWDQNGNLVRYQVMMNEVEFDYIVANELYNLDGQIAFSQNHNKVDFPSSNRKLAGAIEIKLAWREMDESTDISARYLTTRAYVSNEKNEYSIKKMGLVGMHISMKTETSPQWIWATFEHIDNVEANSLEYVDGKQVKASFNDPSCELCPINVYPNMSGDYANPKDKNQATKRNQIQRVLPISDETNALNTQVQALLATQQSPLQYYELVGTQWPTEPSSPAYDVNKHDDANPPALPDAVSNKSGGKPTPIWLTNMVMETYFQGATDASSHPKLTDAERHALYNTKIANEEAWNQIEGFKTYGTNHERIFGTESCIGCHSSASIAIGYETNETTGKKTPTFGAAGIADFSWLLQIKAKFKQ
jgi:hypothetical protein